MRRFLAAVALSAFAATSFPQSLPPYFPLPAGAQVSNVTFENYGEAPFVVPNSDQASVQHGKHWYADVSLPGLAEDMEQTEVWARIKPVLAKAGWTAVFEANANPFSATVRNAAKNAWAGLDVYGSRDIRVNVIEVAAMTSSFTLRPPAAKPESVSADSGDFPYLAPLPGSSQNSSSYDGAPMLVQLPGEAEPQTVAAGAITKDYAAPEGLSNLAFATLYGQALQQAGWNVLENSHGIQQTDVAITAHYARNGRNLWSTLHYSGGSYTICVADAGAEQLAAELAKNCHVPVYGILFDFGKATLRPDSEPQLQKVQQLFASDPSLKLVVEGHTDNVGTAAHNQTLSEQRAASVVRWLVAHGVAANRVSSKGYGLTRPIASNDDDAGRAKNRRVELRKEGCSSGP